MQVWLAEFLGTALLILFGNGVVANVLLPKTKGHDSGWIVISAGWGLGVFIGAFCSAPFSGAHLNPAVTLAMCLTGKLGWELAGIYVLSQFAGAMCGAVLVYLYYMQHFKLGENADHKMACFCTAPNIRHKGQAFWCELLGTYVLILPIFMMADPNLTFSLGTEDPRPATLGLGTIGLLPVGLLVFAIGLSLGGTTGYAINPARDLGPRLIHALLPIPGKRDSDWAYAWVPVLGPLAGGSLAALTYLCLIR